MSEIHGKDVTMQGRNIAGSAGRWSAAHWKTATFGWLALVVAAVVLGSIVGSHSRTDAEQSNGETARAERMLADAGIKAPVNESVLVQSKGSDVHAPAFRVALRDVRAVLARQSQVTGLHAPVVSKDGHSALVEFSLAGPSDSADSRVAPCSLPLPPPLARALVLSVGAVEKHVANILGKLPLSPSDDDHRRVLAVLAYLQSEDRR
ncbi:MAG: hypothetical protein ABI317_00270 [Gaiellales bacterium]